MIDCESTTVLRAWDTCMNQAAGDVHRYAHLLLGLIKMQFATIEEGVQKAGLQAVHHQTSDRNGSVTAHCAIAVSRVSTKAILVTSVGTNPSFVKNSVAMAASFNSVFALSTAPYISR